MSKPSKTSPIEIDRQRLVARAQSIDTHVELSSPEEKRVKQVALADIGLGRVISVKGFPLGDISNFIEEENSFALAFGSLVR